MRHRFVFATRVVASVMHFVCLFPTATLLLCVPDPLSQQGTHLVGQKEFFGAFFLP